MTSITKPTAHMTAPIAKMAPTAGGCTLKIADTAAQLVITTQAPCRVQATKKREDETLMWSKR